MANNSQSIDIALQSCLDMILSRGETIESALAHYPGMAETLKPELEAAQWMWTFRTAFDPRPGFVYTSQRRLMARIQQNGGVVVSAPAAAPKRRFLPVFWQNKLALQFALILVLVISLLFGSGGVALASQSSMPGETLYPVKIALEQAALAVTPSKVGDARLHIEYAQRRLIEIQILVVEGQYQNIPSSVSSFEKHVDQAVKTVGSVAAQDPTQARLLAVALHGTLSGQAKILAALSEVLPSQTRSELDKALMIADRGEKAVEGFIPGPAISPTETPTPTPTVTPSDTPASASATPTATSTPSPVPSPTWTETPTITSTPTSTPAAAFTSTPIPTIKAKKTSKPEVQPTQTRAPAATSTRPPAPTSTPRPTPVPPTQPPYP